ncbi:protein kinase domain-containing protein [Novipirellula artificiosorum]|uniref:Serine/threonine-protein kinase PrkC n=1 Tax=Novipirellula artificiosorum TaxID=2528016 RepID=A0A5C6DR94_9BACT|nr:protein kinase [Novipirellula artificiosorum]TWU39172.1 Serine/threonine-protein kinase PrkC [Novipirellula artificiosorum]
MSRERIYRWLICLVVTTAVVAAVVIQWFSGTTAGAAFVLLSLWGASRFLSPLMAKLVALAVVMGSVSTLMLQNSATLIEGLDQMAVITGAMLVWRREYQEYVNVDLHPSHLMGELPLPFEDDAAATISVDSDRDPLGHLRVSEIAGRDLLERMKHSKAFLPKQIDRVQRFITKRSDTSVSMERVVNAGLLTEFQAMHLHWGREDQLRFDKYSLAEMIGRGGMSTVYRAMNMERGETVALKLMAANEKAICRAQRETEIAKQLAHKNIVVAYDSGRIRSRFYIEMEYVSGSDLHQIVKRNGPLPESTALNYAVQIARGLQHAHAKGLIHRDVKPGNILVTADGVVKITDLGLARNMGLDDQDREYRTNPHHLVGTIEFMSPEQALHENDVDERADIYSLGATLFFLLTGQTRVIGKTVGQQITNLVSKRRFLSSRKLGVREEVAKLIDLLCDHHPDHRIESMTSVIPALESLLGGQEQGKGAIHVLIVEDNHDDRAAARRMLGRVNRSLRIAEATTLGDCHRIMQNGNDSAKVDLVLLDLNLPDSAGVETIKRFRLFCSTTPLVVMTGITDPEYCARCIEAGANDYLPKGHATAESLERSIFMTLARSRIESEESDDDSGVFGN